MICAANEKRKHFLFQMWSTGQCPVETEHYPVETGHYLLCAIWFRWDCIRSRVRYTKITAVERPTQQNWICKYWKENSRIWLCVEEIALKMCMGVRKFMGSTTISYCCHIIVATTSSKHGAQNQCTRPLGAASSWRRTALLSMRIYTQQWYVGN